MKKIGIFWGSSSGNTEIAVELTVNERGSGYTDSCGSGATAAAICMFKIYELENESKVLNSTISIKQKGGTLCVNKKYKQRCLDYGLEDKKLPVLGDLNLLRIKKIYSSSVKYIIFSVPQFY